MEYKLIEGEVNIDLVEDRATNQKSGELLGEAIW